MITFAVIVHTEDVRQTDLIT